MILLRVKLEALRPRVASSWNPALSSGRVSSARLPTRRSNFSHPRPVGGKRVLREVTLLGRGGDPFTQRIVPHPLLFLLLGETPLTDRVKVVFLRMGRRLYQGQ